MSDISQVLEVDDILGFRMAIAALAGGYSEEKIIDISSVPKFSFYIVI